MGVSQERRQKLVIAILVVLAVLLLFGSVGAGVVGSGPESVEIEWLVPMFASAFGFLLAVGTIIEVLQSEPSKSYHTVRPWNWLLVPANGAFVGLALGLYGHRGFWPGFLLGFGLGALLLGFALLLNIVPQAVRRFAKPP